MSELHVVAAGSAGHPYAVRICGGEFMIQKIKTPNGKEFILMHLPYYLGTKLYEYIENLVKKHP